MRTVLLVDEYLPDGTRAHSKMLHELACDLKNSDHASIVVTPGTPNQAKKLLVENVDGIEVWRFRSGYTRGVGKFKRTINEFLLSFKAWSAIKRKVSVEKFDLCINYSPTIFFGLLSWRLKQQGTFVYLVLRDMFPQWIIDQGLIKEKSLIAYFFRCFEKLNYLTADYIGVQSKGNLDLFLANFPDFKNVEILKNWASPKAIQKDEWGIEFKENLQIGKSTIFFYGGNIGHAQDMSNVMRLAKNLNNTQDAHFLIVGQGDEYDLIQKLKTDWILDNVTIFPSVSQEKYEKILAIADVGLFSLSKEHLAHNFPGKILGYMKAGKPILGSVNLGNDLVGYINESNAGFVFINGEDAALAAAAKKLAEDRDFRKELGENSRALLLSQFSVEHATNTILSSVQKS